MRWRYSPCHIKYIRINTRNTNNLTSNHKYYNNYCTNYRSDLLSEGNTTISTRFCQSFLTSSKAHCNRIRFNNRIFDSHYHRLYQIKRQSRQIHCSMAHSPKKTTPKKGQVSSSASSTSPLVQSPSIESSLLSLSSSSPTSLTIHDYSIELATIWSRILTEKLALQSSSSIAVTTATALSSSSSPSVSRCNEFFQFLLQAKRLPNQSRDPNLNRLAMIHAVTNEFLPRDRLMVGYLLLLKELSQYPETLSEMQQCLSGIRQATRRESLVPETNYSSLMEGCEVNVLQQLFTRQLYSLFSAAASTTSSKTTPTKSKDREQSSVKILKLLLQCYGVFPQLSSIPVDDHIMEQFIQSLIDDNLVRQAIGFFKIYQNILPARLRSRLISCTIEQKFWDALPRIVGSTDIVDDDHDKSGETSRQNGGAMATCSPLAEISEPSDGLDDVDTDDDIMDDVLESETLVGSDGADNIAVDDMTSLTSQLIGMNVLEGDSNSKCSVSLPLSELVSVLNACLDARETTSIQAAVDIAKYFKLKPWIRKASVEQKYLRVYQLVQKDKWQLANQKVKTKSSAKILFDCLMQFSKYKEADEVYKQHHLEGLVTVVAQESIVAQMAAATQQYLALPLPPRNIIVVDSAQSLAVVKAVLLAPMESPASVRFVGVDSEWFASVRKSQPYSGASILQVSTADYAFIFDFHAFCPGPWQNVTTNNKFTPLQNEARLFLSSLFSNPRIIKVGWAFCASDLDMLSKAGNGVFRDTFQDVHGMLELSNMVSDLKLTQPGSTPSGKKRGIGLSLSEECKNLLGKPLNKGQRMSNWDLRPLSSAQLTYASLDAHSLLGMLDRIFGKMGIAERTGAGDLYIDDEIEALMSETSAVTAIQQTSEVHSTSGQDWIRKYVTV